MGFLGTKYPIVCPAMTGVSDVRLAVAVSEAGAMPSLSTVDKTLDQVELEVQDFHNQTGHGNFILTCFLSDDRTHTVGLAKLFEQYRIPFCELVTVSDQAEFFYRFLKKLGTVVLTKEIDHRTQEPIFDGGFYKGSEAAGAGSRFSTAELFHRQLATSAEWGKPYAVIPAGGISTPQQVQYYLEHGAPAVCVGSLFAATVESCVSDETKQAIIRGNSGDLKRFSDHGQQGLISRDQPGQEENHTASLLTGVAGDLDQGHIYVGTGIDHINKILPVADVVEYLTTSLS